MNIKVTIELTELEARAMAYLPAGSSDYEQRRRARERAIEKLSRAANVAHRRSRDRLHDERVKAAVAADRCPRLR